jgi:lipopolysaccharide export system permease protein
VKILTGYIAKEASLYSLIALGVFTALLLVGRLLQLTDLIISKGVDPTQVAMVFVSLIPTFLEIALPIAVLLGVMTTFSRMSGDSELIVLRANGLNLVQLLPGVLLVAIFALCLHCLISFQLRPWGYRNLSYTLFDIAKSKSTSGLSAGLFNNLGKIMIYAEELDSASGDMQRVLIEDDRDPDGRKIISAQSGKLTSNTDSRQIIIQLFNGGAHEIRAGQYSLTRFNTTILRISTDEIFSQDSKLKNKGGRELPLANLAEAKEETITQRKNLFRLFQRKDGDLSKREFEEQERILKQLSRNIHSYDQEFYSRFMLPWASFIFAILAVPLGVIPPRAQKSWGQTVSLITGLLVFVFYFGVFSIAAASSESLGIPAALTAGLPNLIFACITYFFIRKISSEKWNSIAGALKEKIDGVKNWRESRKSGEPR